MLPLAHTVPHLQMQRDSAKESVAEARENFNAAVNAFKAKQEEVEPLQKGRKDQNNMQRNVQAEFRDLEVRSEQELDTKVPKGFLSIRGLMHIATQCSTSAPACCSNKTYIYMHCTILAFLHMSRQLAEMSQCCRASANLAHVCTST